jgi:hypothetical protein
MDTYRVPPSLVGVYHLLRGDTVVYVGQSTNVLARIANWVACRAFDFDGYRVIPCAVADLNATERDHIERYQPEHNRAGRDMRYNGVRRGVRRGGNVYASVDEYLANLPARLSASRVCSALRIAPNAAALLELVAIGAFPRPACRVGKRHYWDREEVRAAAQRTEAA